MSDSVASSSYATLEKTNLRVPALPQQEAQVCLAQSAECMTQSGGIAKVSVVSDRKPASDLHVRGEGRVWSSGYGTVVLVIAREPANSVEDRAIAIGNRVSDLLRRARAEHRALANVADQVRGV